VSEGHAVCCHAYQSRSEHVKPWMQWKKNANDIVNWRCAIRFHEAETNLCTWPRAPAPQVVKSVVVEFTGEIDIFFWRARKRYYKITVAKWLYCLHTLNGLRGYPPQLNSASSKGAINSFYPRETDGANKIREGTSFNKYITWWELKPPWPFVSFPGRNLRGVNCLKRECWPSTSGFKNRTASQRLWWRWCS